MWDVLWPGGPRFDSAPDVFKLGSDAVLLADFVHMAQVRRACDLGCGCGVIAVLLALKAPAAEVTAIDLSEQAVALTQRNAEANGLAGRVHAQAGDLREIRSLLPAGGFDLVVSNPPYFQAGSGKRTARAGLVSARGELTCRLEDVCAAARHLLRWGGRFALVFRPERLAELFATMQGQRLTPKKLRMVQNRADCAPSLVLVEGRHGGRTGLEILPPLLLTENGEESAEIRRIYRRGT